MANPILTLDTLTEYPTVQIDGHAYALLPADALPVDAYQQFERVSTRFTALWKKPDRTPEERTELAQLLDTLCRAVLQAPPDVHERLSDIQRLQIAQAFLELPHVGLQGLGQRTTLKPSTGASSPRGSNGSTAARIPTRGSRGSRFAGSGRSSR